MYEELSHLLRRVQVTNFPYPTPPLPLGLREAIRCLEALGAMDPSSGNLTTLGRDMATLPVSPRHSRLILQVTPPPSFHPHSHHRYRASELSSSCSAADGSRRQQSGPPWFLLFSGFSPM
jgi:hypothetical protein